MSALTSVMAAIPQSVKAVTLPDPESAATLRISCQEGVAPGKSLSEKLDFIESLGIVGLEPGGGGLSKRVEDFKKALEGRKIKISAICAGFKGCMLAETPEKRKECTDSIKEILTAAGELGSTGVIAVPAFNGQTKMGHKESRELLVKEILPDLAEHARKAGTRLLLEPLNRGEAHFLRQVPDAAAICRDVNNTGLSVMGDFWHMTWEETDDMAAFISAAKYLHHVHMASRKTRNMPGDDEGDNYVRGFKGLKVIGYQDFVSFECGSKGDRKQALTKAVSLLREQWEQA